MSYVDENLMPGEKVLFETQLHWIVYAPLAWMVVAGWMFGQIEGVGSSLFWTILVIALLLVPLVAIHRSVSEFAVTNRRFIAKTGWVSRKTVETALHKIEVLSVEQGITGRMLGYGTIVVTGTGGTPNAFKQVDNPIDVRRSVYEQIQKSPENPPETPTVEKDPGGDVISRLERLAALRRDGVLNDREFEEQKRKLMDG